MISSKCILHVILSLASWSISAVLSAQYRWATERREDGERLEHSRTLWLQLSQKTSGPAPQRRGDHTGPVSPSQFQGSGT